MPSRLSVQRLRTILERQQPGRFGSSYEPSIKAVRSEAPSISRPTRLYVPKLGRLMHLLSDGETNSALLAAYHPWVFDIHEQKMLHRWPGPHPLRGLPMANSSTLPSVTGTVAIAERLGYLDLHPIVYDDDPERDDDKKMALAYPYIGDLLLFIRDDDGCYCVNWPIKDKAESFQVSDPRLSPKTTNKKARRKALARMLIEETYHAEVGITTHRIAKTAIDFEVTANLRFLITYADQPTQLSAYQVSEIEHLFQLALEQRCPPSEVFILLISRHNYSDQDLRTVLFTSIWHRRLRVDLFSPILVNEPLRPEKRDVLEEYSEWFKR